MSESQLKEWQKIAKEVMPGIDWEKPKSLALPSDVLQGIETLGMFVAKRRAQDALRSLNGEEVLKVIRKAQKALQANHKWHQDYDDYYSGYPDSELCEQNEEAIRGLRLLFGEEEKNGTLTDVTDDAETGHHAGCAARTEQTDENGP